MSPPKHTLFTFRTKVRTLRLSFLATRYQAHASRMSKKPSCTYDPRAARGYCVNLQRWEYMERRTPENIFPIRLTSGPRSRSLQLRHVLNVACKLLCLALFVRVQYIWLGFYLSTMFEKATAPCIVVILFYVGFLLCDVWAGEWRGAILTVTLTLSVPKMVWRHPLSSQKNTSKDT